jgi:hypothetical protein
VYTADENLNDIGEVAPACRRRRNVFAHSWALFSQLAVASVGRHTRHTRHAAWAHNAQAMPDPLGGVSIQSAI